MEAHNGEDALIKAVLFKPDLILLDVMMPKMNGWEVYGKLKEHAELKEIPVIMVTAVSQLDESFENINAQNIKGYIKKPFDFSELIKTIEKNLGQAVDGSPFGSLS